MEVSINKGWKSYIVLEPNYRGSSGYGNEFLKTFLID
jgi:hypothetical protein